jgi:hypothetical protein
MKLLPKISRINFKSSTECERTEEFKSKQIQGQIYQHLERPSVDKEKSPAWLWSSGLKGEMESLITAAQHQALNMCYPQRIIMKQPTDSYCRMCYKAEEHIKHIVT